MAQDDASTAEADTVTITVAVTDPQGAGIGGVDVTLSWNGTEQRTGTTRSNGKMFFDVPDDERIVISLNHSEYVRNFEAVEHSPNDGDTVNVTMYPRATESVQVVDGDGDPVEGASVFLRKEGQARNVDGGRTNADGVWSSQVVEEGEYRVTVVKDGYFKTKRTVTVSGSSNHTVTIEQGTVQIDLSVVDGRLDEETPLSNVEVTVTRDGERIVQRFTDQKGQTTTVLPVNSEYTLELVKDGYTAVTRTVEVGTEPKDVELRMNRTPELSLTASTSQVLVGNSLTVTVTDEYDEPVEGAAVTVDGEQVATTGPDGRASVTLDSVGTFQVAASTDEASASGVSVKAVRPATSTAPETSTTEETTTTAGTTEATSTMPGADGTTSESDEGSGSVPGFGGLAALVALAGGVLAARYRAGSRR